MTREEQIEHLSAFQAAQEFLMTRKGDDYANEDRLSNFKLAGAIVGLTPEMVALTMISVKVARLGVLLKGKVPNNESVRDSIIDLANYSVLMDQILSEYDNNSPI